jgi:hypothetical protein
MISKFFHLSEGISMEHERILAIYEDIPDAIINLIEQQA